jgi:hypothetical protein
MNTRLPLNLKLIVAFILVGVIAACSNPSAQTQSSSKTDSLKTSPANSASPFHFYKDIEIKPGLHFEVVSWGKGVDTLGAVQILRSDSLKNSYRSVSFERQGIVRDAWNLDLDNDGNPEIYIQTEVQPNHNDLFVYEYGSDFDKLSFPGLKNVKGYSGGDKFFVKAGELYRTVPIVQTDSASKATLVKTFKYHLSGNSFSSSEAKIEP